jgi:uncharacterized membrane protein YheB (UPF0754 family)
MRESILTIPVSEIFEPKCGCPICRMRDMLEDRCVEYIMGAAMMEPDVRIETNKMGFCKTHFDKMLKQKNRLSLALMLDTHLNEIDEKIINKKGLFESSKTKKQKLSAVNNDCFVCSKIEWGMQRLMVTVFELYQKEAEFVKLFNEQEMLCLNHYELLISLAQNNLPKAKVNSFVQDCDNLIRKYLSELKKDVAHYCKMYDYRNSGKDADWGNSKDSIERAIKFLTTR